MESRCGADVVNQTWINLAIFQRAILAGKLPNTEYQSNKNRLRNFLRHVAFFLRCLENELTALTLPQKTSESFLRTTCMRSRRANHDRRTPLVKDVPL